MPFFAIAALTLFYIIDDVVSAGIDIGHVIGMTIVGFVTLLLGYQVVQSIRDLFAPSVETTGRVERLWSRNEFFLFHNGYIFVGTNVFRLEPEEYIKIKLGDTVRIVHYPHTATVETVEVTEPEPTS